MNDLSALFPSYLEEDWCCPYCGAYWWCEHHPKHKGLKDLDEAIYRFQVSQNLESLRAEERRVRYAANEFLVQSLAQQSKRVHGSISIGDPNLFQTVKVGDVVTLQTPLFQGQVKVVDVDKDGLRWEEAGE